MSNCDHAIRVEGGYKIVRPPHVEEVGECGSGCCSRYRCTICGERWTVEWGN